MTAFQFSVVIIYQPFNISIDAWKKVNFPVVKGTDLFEMMHRGNFNPIGDEDDLKEIRKFIENLDGIEITIVSDHILNLLEELNG